MRPNNTPVWILGILLAMSLSTNVWLGTREISRTTDVDVQNCTFITVTNEQAIPVILDHLNKEEGE